MAVLAAPSDFTAGQQVTHTNLNAHVNSATFAAGAVDNSTTQLSGGAIIVKDGGITEAKLATNAVTNSKIADNAVDTAELADGAVTSAKLDTNITVSGQLVGGGTATNDDAGAGVIGEYQISSTGSGSLSVSTAANIASISLTAGDWDVQGLSNFTIGATGTTRHFSVGLTTTSATLPALTTFNVTRNCFEIDPAVQDGTRTSSCLSPVVRFSLSGTTTIYLVGEAKWDTDTFTYSARIRARRVR